MNEISKRLGKAMYSLFVRSRNTRSYHCKTKNKAKIASSLFLSVILLLVMCIPEICLGKVGTGSDEKDDNSSNGVGLVGDSAEDDTETEYLDDEVRFVTEDDFLYEEDRSHSDFNQVSF
jgi:hypothetical protein